MKIAIGSTNPVKIAAVRQMATRVWPEAEIVPLAAESGVSSMPMNSAETLHGAVGALTAGLVPRREAFAIAVAYALSPFLVPDLHNNLTGSTETGDSFF